MRLVVGLGNPGARYAGTRHNLGWRVLDALEARGAGGEERRSAYVARTVGPEPATLVALRPLTYMNRSGEAVEQWRTAHPEGWDGLLVVADDVYLPIGTLRLRSGGSSGGHRGLESIAAVLGAGFARLRLGVGAAEGAEALREHVLEAFTPEDAGTVDAMVERAAEAVACWALEGIDIAMNRYNRRVTKEASEA